MPHIEGIEIPVYSKQEREQAHKADRRAAWIKWYRNIRLKALATLGGRCECGEVNPEELHIIALTEGAKRWSQLLFYKRLIDSFNQGGRPASLGRVVCRKCRYKGMTLAAMDRRERNKRTGEFYWIGGQRVEQVRKRTGRDARGCLIYYPRLEDFILGTLREELAE